MTMPRKSQRHGSQPVCCREKLDTWHLCRLGIILFVIHTNKQKSPNRATSKVWKAVLCLVSSPLDAFLCTQQSLNISSSQYFESYFSCRLPIVARKGTWHATASTANTNVILTSRNYVSLCARYWWWRKLLCPGMLICKTAKPCINSTWIALIMDLCRLKDGC